LRLQPIGRFPLCEADIAFRLGGASRACAGPERARLLHDYALHRASADAQRLADLQYARAALVEALFGFPTDSFLCKA
jgi:hypothetical protein